MRHHLQPTHSILRQFSPLERKSLLAWLGESKFGSDHLHQAYRLSLREALAYASEKPPALHAKVAFMTRHEFGGRLSERALSVLTEAVYHHVQ